MYEYRIIYQIYSGEYDLLTTEEMEEKKDEFWEEFGEGWQSLNDEVDLPKLRRACNQQGISTNGSISFERCSSQVLYLLKENSVSDLEKKRFGY